MEVERRQYEEVVDFFLQGCPSSCLMYSYDSQSYDGKQRGPGYLVSFYISRKGKKKRKTVFILFVVFVKDKVIKVSLPQTSLPRVRNLKLFGNFKTFGKLSDCILTSEDKTVRVCEFFVGLNNSGSKIPPSTNL